jgi:hypothetical protein
MLHCVALVRTNVSEEHSALQHSISSHRALVLVTADARSSLILITLMMEAIHCSKTSVLTRATWRNIPKDGILHSHRRENFKSAGKLYQLRLLLCM